MLDYRWAKISVENLKRSQSSAKERKEQRIRLVVFGSNNDDANKIERADERTNSNRMHKAK